MRMRLNAFSTTAIFNSQKRVGRTTIQMIDRYSFSHLTLRKSAAIWFVEGSAADIFGAEIGGEWEITAFDLEFFLK